MSETASSNQHPGKLARWLWDVDLDQLPAPARWLIVIARVISAVVRDLVEGQITLRAMGMVYSTLLSMVPLLAISFSLVKGLGVVDNQLEPMLLNFVAPMGAQGEEIVARLIGFVNNVNAGALGSVGLAVLIGTVILLLQKIESAFNFIWHVNQSRHFARRFSDFFSVLLIGPLLVVAALGATGAALNNSLVQTVAAVEPFGTLLVLLTKLMPYLLITAAFTFVYMFIANTRVRFGCALIGALVAGVLWETLGKSFGMIFASPTTAAIYSSFAILILFLIWLYWSWLILLIGAQVAFYVQNPQYQRSGHKPQILTSDQQETLALTVTGLIGRSFSNGDRGHSTTGLSELTGVPEETLGPTLQRLQTIGVLHQSQEKPPLWMLSRDPDRMAVSELLEQFRQSSHSTPVKLTMADLPEAQRLLQLGQEGLHHALRGKTLRTLYETPPQRTDSEDHDDTNT